MDSVPNLVPTTRPLQPELIEVLKKLQPGMSIRITQTVRVGDQTWPAKIAGKFRALRSLVTGLATDRIPEDEIIVPTIHFTKENGELSSIAIDEHTLLEIVD